MSTTTMEKSKDSGQTPSMLASIFNKKTLPVYEETQAVYGIELEDDDLPAPQLSA